MDHRRGLEPGVETARQVRGFEDYWCLGPSRSLGKLATEYRRRSDGGEDVPTVRERTLEEWSATYRWRERAAQRERDEAAEAERKNRERVQKFRERVMRAIDIDASAYLQKVSAAIGPNGELGDPQIIRSASDLAKAVGTFLQLAGEPQKHQVNANVNANVSLEGEWQVDPRPNGDLMAVLAVLQELAPLIPPVGEVDGAVVDAVRLALAEPEAAETPAIPAR